MVVAVVQLGLARRESRSRFEDDLVSEYRGSLDPEVALRALIRRALTEDEEKRLGQLVALYRYFDLTNEQVWLRMRGRIRTSTWSEWYDGIKAHIGRYSDEWALFLTLTERGYFRELLILEELEKRRAASEGSDGEIDPYRWLPRPRWVRKRKPDINSVARRYCVSFDAKTAAGQEEQQSSVAEPASG